MKRWFDFRAQARGAEIVIYDEIGAFGIAPPGAQVAAPASGPIEPFAAAKARAVRAFERRYLMNVMEEAGGNVTAAAAAAGKDRRAMGRLLKKHGSGPRWSDAVDAPR